MTEKAPILDHGANGAHGSSGGLARHATTALAHTALSLLEAA